MRHFVVLALLVLIVGCAGVKPKPVPAYGALKVTSAPSGAQVRLSDGSNEVFVGRTPLELWITKLPNRLQIC